MWLCRFPHLAVVICLFAGSSLAKAGDDIDGLLDGVAARASLLTTATIHFETKWTTGPVKHDFKYRYALLQIVKEPDGSSLRKLVYPTIPPDKQNNRDAGSMLAETVSAERVLTIAGNEWAVRSPRSKNVQISRVDYEAVYTENVNPDKSIYRGLQIELPSGAVETGIGKSGEEPWRRITRCGTIPDQRLLEYMLKHRSRARRVGAKVIDGMNADIIEWRVPQDDFHWLSNYALMYLYEGREAILRVFVAKELGYAVPRVEIASVNDEAALWFEATDFRSTGELVYFPYRWKMVNRSQLQDHTLEFHVKSISGVNEPADADAFELDVPRGTRVRNNLPGQEAVFRVGEAVTLNRVSDVMSAVREARSGSRTSVLTSFRLAALIVGNLVLFAVVGYLFVSRRRTGTSGR